MEQVLAPVKCVTRERDPTLDVRIIRKDRSILYKIEPRKVLTVQNEMKQWDCSAAEVGKLISNVFKEVYPGRKPKKVCNLIF